MPPEPLRIEVVEGRSVHIEWDDGTKGEISSSDLRGACMCATCREPAGEAATAMVLAAPEGVAIDGAALVGGYAVTFTFTPDGHRTGIYPFTTLYEMGTSQ